MLRSLSGIIGLLVLAVLVFSVHQQPVEEEWGFFGHRRINRMAVFTLPPEMMRFYRHHIEYITDHAVDPDKRRYATRHEAVRHYMDMDHWGTYPFDNIPRNWTEALLRFGEIRVYQAADTLVYKVDQIIRAVAAPDLVRFEASPQLPVLSMSLDTYKKLWQTYIIPQYYEEEWIIPCDSVRTILGLSEDCVQVEAIDHFSEYGILPFHLNVMQNRLTNAFFREDVNAILRLSTEMGHYIGDGHVPLHTTENYNGEMTNQVGIHAFWESRIPELFADETYDFFVGKAEYIETPPTYFWDVVLASHRLVDSVLAIEKHLSYTIPEDQQYCFEERLGRTIRTQCTEYAAAYQASMNGMVEQRMRESILSIGSSWYTAWVNAGQPDLNRLLEKDLSKKELEEQEALEQAFQGGSAKGRVHGQ